MNSTRIGVFTIGKNLPGAPLATFHLVFNGGSVTGAGQVIQAINPPLRVETFLAGTSRDIVWGADEQQIITLTGHEFHMPMLPNPVNVDCTIALDGKASGKSTASLRYMDAGGDWKELRDQPVKVSWMPMPE